MRPYHKIQGLQKRDPETHRFDGRWTCPEFEWLAGNEWVWTEKLDGMNIRLGFDPEDETEPFQVAGRTARAELPGRLRIALDELDARPVLENISGEWGGRDVVLFGEGIGAKIQGGAFYHEGEPRNEFVLFDVLIGEMWADRETVAAVAEDLGCRVAPLIGSGTIQAAIDLVRGGFNSTLPGASVPAEGLVIRPPVEMRGQWGQRIITKIKSVDF